MANPPEDDAGARRPAETPEGDASARPSGSDAISPPTSSLEREPAAASPGLGSGRGASEPRLDPGQVLAERYEIVRFIAQGGMGDVYEAKDRKLQGTVALKTIRTDLAGRAKALDRFHREVHIARRVTHPNVCRIFDVDEHHAQAPEGSGETRRR